MLMEYVKKKRERKDACPKKVCLLLAKACKKNGDSSRLKITKGEESCKRSSSMNHQKLSTHLHILIRLYDSFLLGSCFLLSNTSKANMPLHSYPEPHISLSRW